MIFVLSSVCLNWIIEIFSLSYHISAPSPFSANSFQPPHTTLAQLKREEIHPMPNPLPNWIWSLKSINVITGKLSVLFNISTLPASPMQIQNLKIFISHQPDKVNVHGDRVESTNNEKQKFVCLSCVKSHLLPLVLIPFLSQPLRYCVCILISFKEKQSESLTHSLHDDDEPISHLFENLQSAKDLIQPLFFLRLSLHHSTSF